MMMSTYIREMHSSPLLSHPLFIVWSLRVAQSLHCTAAMMLQAVVFAIAFFIVHCSDAFVPSPRQLTHNTAASKQVHIPFSSFINEDTTDVNEASSLKRRTFLAQSVVAGLLTVPQLSLADDSTSIDPSVNLPKITSKVYLDIKLPTLQDPKRLVIGLFGEDMPKAASNFQTLCTNTNGPSYAGTNFYRVISETSIQGGAIGKDIKTGKSGTSSFENGAPFEPDNYNILHTKRGLVSGVRNPNGTMDSRFFIQTEDDAGWADGRYAAFGVVLGEDIGKSLGGMELVKKISKVDVKTPQNSPKDPIEIVGCGLL